jgi:hypothetical protein
MDMIEGKADVDRAQLPKISAFDKIIVAFAGPLLVSCLLSFLRSSSGRWGDRSANRKRPRLSAM